MTGRARLPRHGASEGNRPGTGRQPKAPEKVTGYGTGQTMERSPILQTHRAIGQGLGAATEVPIITRQARPREEQQVLHSW